MDTNYSLRLSSPLDMLPSPATGNGDDSDSPAGYAYVVTDTCSSDQVDTLNVPPLPPGATPPPHNSHSLHYTKPDFSSSTISTSYRQTGRLFYYDDGYSNNNHNNGNGNGSRRCLGTLSVVAITFFFVCGGPLGSEPAISIAGPLVALLALLVYPLVFTFPYCAVIAELCTAFPEDGGFPIAVRNAFGPFWGVLVGYLSWVGNIMSTAIYPAMLLDLVSLHVWSISSSTHRYLLKALLAILLSVPSLLGTKFVSKTLICLLFVVLSTVLIYSTWTYSKATTYSTVLQIRRENTTFHEQESSNIFGSITTTGDITIDWMDLLNTVFWNYNGYQMASVFGGQVAIPARVYPRAIGVALLLTVFCYTLPLPATVAMPTMDWTAFDSVSYGDVSSQIGGSVLHTIMLLLNFVTAIGLCISCTYCQATEIAGMAQSGMIYDPLGHENGKFRSPHNSIALTLLLSLVLLALETEFLLPVANCFACLVTTINFLAGVQLRRKYPHFPRPSTVPGGAGMMLCIALVPMGVCGVIIFDTMTESLAQCLMILGFVFAGVVISLIEKRRGGHGYYM